MIRKLITSKNIILISAAWLFLASCEKDNSGNPLPDPDMQYMALNGKEVVYGKPALALDLNKDGRTDLIMGVLPVGDPIFKQDKYQFRAFSDIYSKLAVSAVETTPALSRDEIIPPDNFNGHQWFEASSIILVQKVVTETLSPYWEGNWKNASRKYLAIQCIKNEERFNGWVELSVDTNGEKIILHKAAISTKADKLVYAGH